MNKSLRIILIIVVLVAIISTASYCSAPYDTETTHIISVRKTIEAKGYVLRKETLVNSSSGGVFDAAVADGQRVFKGSRIGVLTTGDFDDDLAAQLEKVSSRINEIKQADSFSELYTSDEARIYSAMHSISSDIRTNVQNDNLLKAYENTELLKSLVEKKHSVENSAASDDLLVSLEEEKYHLEQQLGGVREDVSSPASGYFFKSVDGLEEFGNEEDIKKLSASDIDGFSAKLGEDMPAAFGKIADSYMWYIVASIPKAEAEILKQGDSITISVDDSQFVKATVLAINTSKSDYAAVIIRSDRALPGIYEKRSVMFEVCLDEYTGLYVPSAAIRVVDGIPGVYIMNKTGEVIFRCVNILLEDKDYLIVENEYIPPQEVKFKPLKNYDNILVNPEVTHVEDTSSE